MVSLSEHSLKIWQDQDLEHLRYEYDLKPGDYVIDVGSYRREWADRIKLLYACEVDCFDALDNRAAWTRDGEITTGGQYYYTSIFMPGTTKYRCEDICKYLNREVALVKINIEGGEYELLHHIIESGKMPVIRNLQVQFHIIEGMNYEDAYLALEYELRKTHDIAWRYEFCWESWKPKEHVPDGVLRRGNIIVPIE